MGKLIDLTGQRFGRLTVIQRTEAPGPYYTYGGAWWLCRCDCGNTSTVTRDALQRGTTASCGCYRRERIAEMNKRRSKKCR